MKLSLCSEYALLTLVHLARNNELISLANLAVIQQIPVESLAEILSVLELPGFVKQVDGRFGLAESASEISVAEIIRLFDGALAPLEPVSSKGYAPAPMDSEVKLSGLFEQIQQQISERLESTTIAELA
jgi:Rrf2 family transcriptional regulator, cysteine metabolism repressor